MEETLDYKLDIKIADDYYSATVSIEFFSNDAEKLLSDIQRELKDLNLVYGLDLEALGMLCEKGKDVVDFVIALGKAHLNGEDAKIVHQMDLSEKPHPTLNEDGSVDFKDMNFTKVFAEGEVLARKIPVKPGYDGLTVTGKEIKHKPGKDIVMSPGENTALSDDGLSLVATTDGIVKLVNNRLTIVQQLEINDVGPETGNIYFCGDVHVKGIVMDGYTVNCDGDLTVDGVVEGATLKVRGTLSVGRGIKGRGVSDIVVNGDLISNFIENANIYIKGSIETGEIINSIVLCDGQITVKGKKGLIIGGEITSKYMIEANRIGSRLGVITSINLGIDKSSIVELKALKETVHELKIVEERLKIKLVDLKKAQIIKPDDQGIRDMYTLYKESLISTTIFLEEKEEELNALMDRLRHVNESQLKISTIYPDTIVKIGDSSYFIDHALKDCIITRSDDKVIAIGY